MKRHRQETVWVKQAGFGCKQAVGKPQGSKRAPVRGRGPIVSVFGGKHSPIAREQAKQRATDGAARAARGVG